MPPVLSSVYFIYLFFWQDGRLKPHAAPALFQHDKSLERMRRLGQTLCATAPRGARHLSAGTGTSEWHRQWEKGNVAGNVSKQMRADCGLGFFLR